MPIRKPALESLRYLEACVRHGNFTHAAAELNVTAAAVSLRIRGLEADLKTRLFHRSGPRLTPTVAGLKLAQRVGEALRVIHDAVEEYVETAESLRVTAVPTFAMRWLMQRLPHYRALPGALPVELDASTELRPSESFDVAIRTGTGHWPDLDATALLPVEATPMLNPALAASARVSCPADLASLALLPHDDWPRWFQESGAAAPGLKFCADDYSIHELNAMSAVEGTGVALLSPTFYGPLLKSGQLQQPFAHTLKGPKWHYVLLKTGEKRPAVLRFRDWLQQQALRDSQT